METSYDAVIVGSGFGGGAMACRLSQAGWRVCVLERGRRFGPGDFPDAPGDAPRAFFHGRRNPAGLFDLRIMKDVAVLSAAGVGGGSLIYANVQLRAPDDIFASGWPSAITRAELDPYYDRTEEALRPTKTPDDPALPKVAAFDRASELLGVPAERLPIAVHFGEAQLHPLSGVPQQGCTNVGRCDIGCPVRAKNTVDITYLARAEADGAEVFPSCEVRRLDPPSGGNGRWRVSFRNLQYRNSGTVEAPVVVLAAGALGSSRLLLTNRKRLPRLSPSLGSRFSGNGDALGVAFDPKAPGVSGGRHDYGPTMTSAMVFEDQHFILADGGLPANFGGLLEIVRGYDALTGWKRQLVRLRALAARAGLSDQPVSPAEIPTSFPRHDRGKPPITDSLVFLMFGRDAANGRMRLTPVLRRFDIQWRKEDSQALWDAMERTTEELAAAVGGEPFFALDAGPLAKFITVHPLGGCPMADDPAQGVVDDGGKVHGYDGLYVADGAIVPTALGVNPSKTIAALAERAAERLAATR